MFNIEAGDIWIVKGKSLKSKIISFIQKPFYLKNNASHILISISDGCYIHSTGDKGVHIVSFKEILPQIEDNWKAIRLKNLTPKDKENLVRAVFYYFEQAYNSKFFIATEDTSFCSELAAKIYKKSNIKILNNKKPENVIPADFEKRCNEWEDITKNTEEKFNYFNTMHGYDMHIKATLKLFLGISARRKMDNLLSTFILDKENNMFAANFKQMYKKIREENTNKTNIEYWDDIFKKS